MTKDARSFLGSRRAEISLFKEALARGIVERLHGPIRLEIGGESVCLDVCWDDPRVVSLDLCWDDPRVVRVSGRVAHRDCPDGESVEFDVHIKEVGP